MATVIIPCSQPDGVNRIALVDRATLQPGQAFYKAHPHWYMPAKRSYQPAKQKEVPCFIQFVEMRCSECNEEIDVSNSYTYEIVKKKIVKMLEGEMKLYDVKMISPHEQTMSCYVVADEPSNAETMAHRFFDIAELQLHSITLVAVEESKLKKAGALLVMK